MLKRYKLAKHGSIFKAMIRTAATEIYTRDAYCSSYHGSSPLILRARPAKHRAMHIPSSLIDPIKGLTVAVIVTCGITG